MVGFAAGASLNRVMIAPPVGNFPDTTLSQISIEELFTFN
jgi:hypothetical protein